MKKAVNVIIVSILVIIAVILTMQAFIQHKHMRFIDPPIRWNNQIPSSMKLVSNTNHQVIDDKMTISIKGTQHIDDGIFVKGIPSHNFDKGINAHLNQSDLSKE
ncbi:hypothetical protein PP175_28920 (plasmid) [Aneurinibacillus sp. Ricciae_BoGa-3]|uniref:hypothetical protein n=1 Tax=Aneurinibacillus sp. Ricciae_BoGa-3 TaxID=3022697 RepID=UPI002341BAA8|nr:hypothetical protein [Aneurinibacillus sp. Ricciae_BoGa-3]WCK57214.1 hypothetical protein PP175_28920 [Aneurinibacillus sp. Ricciae_BoGa-3]